MENTETISLSFEELREAVIKANQVKRHFDQIVLDLKACFNRDYTDEQACRSAGINKTTYYDWCNKSNEFYEIMEAAKDNFINKAKGILYDKLEDKDTDAAKFVLERREKNRYSRRQELTGEDGKDIDQSGDALRRIAENTSKLLDK